MQGNLASAGGGSKLAFWIAGVSGALALIGGLAAYFFFVYLPGTPENRYRIGFEAVGRGIDYLVEEEDIIEQISSTGYSGEINLTSRDEFSDSELEATFDVSGEYDRQNASFELSAEGSLREGSERYEASGKMEFRFLGPSAESAPKLYFKFSEAELPEEFEEDLLSSLAFEDGQEWRDVWWVLDFQELLDESLLTDEDLEELDLSGQLTQEDYEELTLIAIDGLREYVFTDDAEKMVFQMGELLGQEDFEGSRTHRYSVTVNRANLEAMIAGMRDEFFKSGVWEKYAGRISEATGSSRQELEEGLSDEEIGEFAAEFSKNVSVEAWVDSESRVLRNLRFLDDDRQGDSYGTYFDLGIILDDGSIGLTTRLVVYSGGWDCRSEYGDREKCPYVYEEETTGAALEEKCGSQPAPADYVDLGDEDSDDWEYYNYSDEGWQEYQAASDEYERCARPAISSLKEDAEPRSVWSFKIVVHPEANRVSYETELEVGKTFSMEMTLELTGQAAVADVREPEGAKSILDVYGEGEIFSPSLNVRTTNALADIASLRAGLETYMANNDANPPAATRTADEMSAFSGLSLGYYDLENVTYFTADFCDGEQSADSASYGDCGWLAFESVHIRQGYRCLEPEELEEGAYPFYPENVITREGAVRRTYAIVYTLPGEFEDSCQDNL